MTATANQREEFLWMLGREYPADGSVLHKGRKLMREGATYGRLAVNACNRKLTDKERHRENVCYLRIRELCNYFDPPIVPVLGGDPRGCTVKLQVPSRRTTDFGHIGICVPTS